MPESSVIDPKQRKTESPRLQGRSLNVFIRKLVLTWIMAVTMHLPFPVVTAESQASCEHSTESAYEFIANLKYVMLGCDYPDDPGNGPFDDDPDEANSYGGPYPTYMRSLTNHDVFWQNLLLPELFSILAYDAPLQILNLDEGQCISKFWSDYCPHHPEESRTPISRC